MTSLNTSARVLALTASLSLLACAPAPTPTPTEPAPAQAETAPAPDAPETRRIAVGESFDIALEGNPSTGYTWDVLQDGAPVLRQDTPPPAPAAEAAAAAAQPRVGAPETRRWRFVGAQAGTTTLHLVYHRPWEKDTPPVREVRYEVEVR